MNNGVKNRYLRMNGWLEFNYVGKEVYKSQEFPGGWAGYKRRGTYAGRFNGGS